MLSRIFLFFFLCTFSVQAQNLPDRPQNYVTDELHLLTTEQEKKLNDKLKDFEKRSTNQIFVYITSSLNGNVMSSYCQEIFHHWQIGQKGKNNGVLVAVFANDHKFRIHTGYGLEGALPDLLTKRIQEDVMVPEFKKNNYYEGLDKGIDRLIYYSGHEYDKKDLEPPFNPWPWIFGFSANIVFLLVYLYNLFKERKVKKKKERKKSTKILLTILAIVFAAMPCVGGIILMFMTIMIADFGSAGRSRGKGNSSNDDSSRGYDSSSSSGSSSSSSDFGGGGGGDSGGGGSDSSW
jgi:uncharacterized protein